MPDFSYGKRTGVTSFKSTVQELCENLLKFQPNIINWVNSSSLSSGDKALIFALIAAVNAGCAAVKALPDD